MNCECHSIPKPAIFRYFFSKAWIQSPGQIREDIGRQLVSSLNAAMAAGRYVGREFKTFCCSGTEIDRLGFTQ